MDKIATGRREKQIYTLSVACAANENPHRTEPATARAPPPPPPPSRNASLKTHQPRPFLRHGSYFSLPPEFLLRAPELDDPVILDVAMSEPMYLCARQHCRLLRRPAGAGAAAHVLL